MSSPSESPSQMHAHSDAFTSRPDLREYLPHLDGLSISEAQKAELLQALWSTMSTFVDLAFGTDPGQQVLAARDVEVRSPDAPPTDQFRGRQGDSGSSRD